MALGAHILPVKSVPSHMAEDLLAAGDDQTLMEHVVEVAGKAGVGADVLIVEGMNPEPGIVHASRVNELMLKALDAELVLVARLAARTRRRSPTPLPSRRAVTEHCPRAGRRAASSTASASARQGSRPRPRPSVRPRAGARTARAWRRLRRPRRRTAGRSRR